MRVSLLLHILREATKRPTKRFLRSSDFALVFFALVRAKKRPIEQPTMRLHLLRESSSQRAPPEHAAALSERTNQDGQPFLRHSPVFPRYHINPSDINKQLCMYTN
jgi:hypothetical protein